MTKFLFGEIANIFHGGKRYRCFIPSQLSDEMINDFSGTIRLRPSPNGIPNSTHQWFELSEGLLYSIYVRYLTGRQTYLNTRNVSWLRLHYSMLTSEKKTDKIEPLNVIQQYKFILKQLEHTKVITIRDLHKINATITSVSTRKNSFRSKFGYVNNDIVDGEQIYLSPPTDVRHLTHNLLHYINDSNADPLISPVILIPQYLYIHPHMDGNGRTCLLLLRWLLRRAGFSRPESLLVSVYWTILNLQRKISPALADYRDGNFEQYLNLWDEALIWSRKQLLSHLSLIKQYIEKFPNHNNHCIDANLLKIILRPESNSENKSIQFLHASLKQTVSDSVFEAHPRWNVNWLTAELYGEIHKSFQLGYDVT